MRFYVKRPYPLPSSRIKYTSLPPPPFPPIVAQIEFGPDIGTTEAQDTNNKSEHEPPQNLETPYTCSNGRKIARPYGEPGRPNSGGFSLVTKLAKTGWSKKSIEQLAVCPYLGPNPLF